MNMQACSTILHVSPSEALSKEYIESYYGNQNLEAPCQLCRIHAILDKEVDMFLAVSVFFTIFYNERLVCLQVNPQNIHEYNYVFVFSTQHHDLHTTISKSSDTCKTTRNSYMSKQSYSHIIV